MGRTTRHQNLQMTPILEALWDHLQPIRLVRTSSADRRR